MAQAAGQSLHAAMLDSSARAKVRDEALGKSRVTPKSVTLTRGNVPWYIGTMIRNDEFAVERVQTGVRIEKRLLKVLKGLAEFHDMTLGDLLEGIVLHAFDGKCAFQAESLARIRELKKFYGLNLDSSASHRLTEANKSKSSSKRKRA
jgi:hypothetical protein